jgi:hypothetical protein
LQQVDIIKRLLMCGYDYPDACDIPSESVYGIYYMFGAWRKDVGAQVGINSMDYIVESHK